MQTTTQPTKRTETYYSEVQLKKNLALKKKRFKWGVLSTMKYSDGTIEVVYLVPAGFKNAQ